MLRARISIICLMAVLAVSGCATREGPRQVLLNTPAQHVSSGLQLLDAGRLTDAGREFEAATVLDGKYAGGYIGLAIVEARKGQFEKATRLIHRAASFAGQRWERAQLEVANMELFMAEAKPGWLERVEAAYARATSIAPLATRATYTLALSYLKALRFDLARVRFDQLAAGDDSLAFLARAGVELCDKVLEADPRTELGKRTALIRLINRAELAALLVAEVDLPWPPPDKPLQATDVRPDLPQAEAIHRVIASKIKGFPLQGGGQFVAPLTVKRQDLAMVALGVVEKISGRQNLLGAYEAVGVEDLPKNENYALAISRCLDWRLMDRIHWSRFDPRAPVSGADALLVLKRAERYGRQLKD